MEFTPDNNIQCDLEANGSTPFVNAPLTYKNIQYNFLFDYPNDLEVQENLDSNPPLWRIGKKGDQGNTWLQFSFSIIPYKGQNFSSFINQYYGDDVVVHQEPFRSGVLAIADGESPYSYFQVIPHRNQVIVFGEASKEYLKSSEFSNILSSFYFPY